MILAGDYAPGPCSVDVNISGNFYIRKKKLLNERNTKTFSEKIIFRKVHPLPVFSSLTDKIAVRDYVKRRVGEKYLVPLYGTYDRLTEEDIKHLPESFVLKLKLIMVADLMKLVTIQGTR
ncbi:MAG: hypothetical protein GX587_00890 [Bacteroidales bacterium]|nr:hypothetical protein [Bacteroidales bacterium]